MADKTSKKRNGNMELLRLLSMIMVVTAHLLDKGGLLVELTGETRTNAWIAWALESIVTVSVNLFVLISGYFLVKSRFKLGRLLDLVGAVLFYSLGGLVVCSLTGVVNISEMGIYELVTYVLPIHSNQYWFLTSYVIIYMLSPLINRAVNTVTRGQLGSVIVLLLIYECAFKTLLPIRLPMDKMGYDTFWMFIMYLIGAYIRLYGLKWYSSVKRAAVTYVTALVLVFAELVGLMHVAGHLGRLKEIQKVSIEHNHLLLIVAAVSLFYVFLLHKPMKERAGNVICALSPMALGIYLLHESLSIRYRWQEWLGVKDILDLSTPAFLGRVLLTLIIVAAAGLAVDFVRIKIFDLIRKLFKNSRITRGMISFDSKINGESND